MARTSKRKGKSAAGEFMTAVTKKVGKLTFRKAKGSRRPWWKPGQDKKHPREITGTVDTRRTMKGGKFKRKEPQIVLDISADDGASWSVACSASLQRQVQDENVQAGQMVNIVYKGTVKIKGRSNPMHDFDLFIGEM